MKKEVPLEKKLDRTETLDFYTIPSPPSVAYINDVIVFALYFRACTGCAAYSTKHVLEKKEGNLIQTNETRRGAGREGNFVVSALRLEVFSHCWAEEEYRYCREDH